jgi:hypothetical protein
LQRFALASELALTIVLAAGCASILGLDEHRVGTERDAGTDAGRDAGRPPDAGCPLRYLDDDGDGSGDPATETETCDTATHVDNADDCDDTNPDIEPGATETCDDVDQDCDGAIDEGLMGPIGDPIVVTPDITGITSRGEDLAALEGGTVAVWANPEVFGIRATFLDREGNVLAANVDVETGSSAELPTSPVVSRFAAAGEQVVIVWNTTSGVAARLFGANGAPARESFALALEANTSDVQIASLGARMIAAWENGDDVHLVSFDPLLRMVTSVLVIPGEPPMEDQLEYFALVTVGGSSPHALIVRPTSATTFEILRVELASAPSWNATDGTFEWDASARCALLGQPSCNTFTAFVSGADGVPDRASLVAVEALANLSNPDAGTGTLSVSALPLTPHTAGSPTMGEPFALPSSAFLTTNIAVHGGVATMVLDASTGYAMQEVPISPRAEGSAVAALPAFLRGGSFGIDIARFEAHGALLGNDNRTTDNDRTLVRLGCLP